MPFNTNKANWQTKWSTSYDAFKKNAPDVLSSSRAVSRIMDYNGGSEYQYNEYDNNQVAGQVMDLETKNRMFTWGEWTGTGRRFTRQRVVYPILLDTEQQVFNTLDNPQDKVLACIRNTYVKHRNKAFADSILKDAKVVSATGAVSTVTAANDGVETLDLATTPTEFDKNVFANIRSNFIRKEQVDPNNPDLGIEVFISQKEEAQIILDASFSNKDYYADPKDL
jgi:hypothetical protein